MQLYVLWHSQFRALISIILFQRYQTNATTKTNHVCDEISSREGVQLIFLKTRIAGFNIAAVAALFGTADQLFGLKLEVNNLVHKVDGGLRQQGKQIKQVAKQNIEIREEINKIREEIKKIGKKVDQGQADVKYYLFASILITCLLSLKR